MAVTATQACWNLKEMPTAVLGLTLLFANKSVNGKRKKFNGVTNATADRI